MQRIIVQTEDGSASVYVPELDESYHSKFGSVQESQHVFIDAGLKAAAENKKKVNILEIGFGTGLNAFLTYLWAKNKEISIDYTAIELYPLPEEIFAKLNYPEVLGTSVGQDIFLRMHDTAWNEKIYISGNFSLLKQEAALQDFHAEQVFGLIYFDAFAPRVQPELWTEAVFKKMYDCLEPGGILVTYCAKGDVKRNMKAAGFSLEALPGPKGKREMTRAIKS